jgi:hypothetical protein
MSQLKTVASDGSTEGQYLTQQELEDLIGNIDLSDLELIRMDSYSDSAIFKKIKETKKEKELLCSAIQTAIVGMGNKKYGAMSIKGEIIDIEELYKECDVKIKLTQGSVLKPDDLTGRRLQRFYRKQISQYLQKHDTSSYLWRKYSDHNEDYKHLVFPGAEHLIEKNDELIYLFHVYRTLDEKFNTNVSERIHRVYNARGYYVKEIERHYSAATTVPESHQDIVVATV